MINIQTSYFNKIGKVCLNNNKYCSHTQKYSVVGEGKIEIKRTNLEKTLKMSVVCFLKLV